jgi:hypothetical protein
MHQLMVTEKRNHDHASTWLAQLGMLLPVMVRLKQLDSHAGVDIDSSDPAQSRVLNCHNYSLVHMLSPTYCNTVLLLAGHGCIFRL